MMKFAFFLHVLLSQNRLQPQSEHFHGSAELVSEEKHAYWGLVRDPSGDYHSLRSSQFRRQTPMD